VLSPLAALAPTPADAAVIRASCVDGGGVRWDVAVTWGATYTSSGTSKVSLDKAAWTTEAGSVPTDSRVRTYDGTGRQLQDLRWSGALDYNDGASFKSRNPVNPPSAPGRARVVVTLGVDGDGYGGCSVTSAQPGATRSASDRYEAEVVAATNAERTDRGLVAVRAEDCVDSYAEAQARRMAAEGRMVHQDLGPVMAACDLQRVGENVAYGYPTGTAVTAGWMGSPGHRANILKPEFRLIGVGAAQGSDGRWYAAQVLATLR
jgi:uncharacterized protein YkwD